MGKHANNPNKKKSGRQTLKNKYKIQKKVSTHNKKIKKEARKMKKSGLYKKKMTKQDDLPNLFPFKANVIISHQREQEIQKAKMKNLRQKMKKLPGYQQGDELKVGQIERIPFNLQEIIKKSNIILEILDSRNPQICRSITHENKLKPNQKLILVLNKSDLIPEKLQIQWLKKLSKDHTVVFFNKHNAMKELKVLIQKFNMENKDQKSTIGIVGFPNVGKKTVQTFLLDTFQNDEQIDIIQDVGTFPIEEDQNYLVQNSLIKIEQVQNPQDHITFIINNIEKKKILTLYRIADFQDEKQFLTNVGESKAKFEKKGVVNTDQIARMVVNDWINGTLKYYHSPSQ